MAIDLFGHGPDNLPVPNDYGQWTHGPDPQIGPPCCRSLGTNCDHRKCNDHVCCCDPCRHSFKSLCQGGCCKCTPISICAVFRPYAYYLNSKCKLRSWRLTPGHDTHFSTYSFNYGGGTITLTVGEPQLGSPLYNYADCSWKIYSYELGIEEEYEIIHEEGQIHCQAPPDFTITNVNRQYTDDYGYTQDCYGDITFEEFTMDKIPFLYRWWDDDELQFTYPVCGTCSQVCTVLSVRKGDANDPDYTSDVCDEFYWNGSNGWSGLDTTETIELVELYGECYLKLTNWNTATLQGDLIRIDADYCAEGMVLTARDEIGNWVKIGCNPCYCYKYLCGTCRCVCNTLCVVGFEGGYAQGPYELAWDKDNNRWGDPYSDALVVYLSSDEYGSCQVSMTGFTDPVSIEDTCGMDISFTFSDPIDVQLEYGVRYYTGFCRACEGSCSAGTCLDDCEDVPRILYAGFEPDSWTPMLGCTGPFGDCFTAFTFELVQLFVPTLLNPAGEWRWQGSKAFQCTGCDTGGNPGFKTPRTNIVQIDIGCDGQGTVSVTGEDTSGNTYVLSWAISFTLPCGLGATWNLGPYTEANGGSLICCLEAGFTLNITDTP